MPLESILAKLTLSRATVSSQSTGTCQLFSDWRGTNIDRSFTIFNLLLDKRIHTNGKAVIQQSQSVGWSQPPGTVSRICNSPASNHNGRWIYVH